MNGPAKTFAKWFRVHPVANAFQIGLGLGIPIGIVDAYYFTDVASEDLSVAYIAGFLIGRTLLVGVVAAMLVALTGYLYKCYAKHRIHKAMKECNMTNPSTESPDMTYAFYRNFVNRTVTYHIEGKHAVGGTATRNGEWCHNLPDLDAVYNAAFKDEGTAVVMSCLNCEPGTIQTMCRNCLN